MGNLARSHTIATRSPPPPPALSLILGYVSYEVQLFEQCHVL